MRNIFLCLIFNIFIKFSFQLSQGEELLKEAQTLYDNYIKSLFGFDNQLEEERGWKLPDAGESKAKLTNLNVVVSTQKEKKETYLDKKSGNDEDTEEDENKKKKKSELFNFESQEQIMSQKNQDAYFKKAIISALINQRAPNNQKYSLTLTKTLRT